MSSWGDVAAERNRQKVDAYVPNPAWHGVTPFNQSEWMKRREFDPEAEQKHYDEFEQTHAARTTRTFWGRERKVDSRGREVKNPKRSWFQGWF